MASVEEGGNDFLPIGGKKNPFHCSYCKRDITLQFRVHCAECSNFNLCADCFSSGVSLHPHESSHSYRVVKNLDFPIFVKDWTANEELLLLEGYFNSVSSSCFPLF